MFHIGQFFPDDRIARDQHDGDRLSQIMLVQSKGFTQEPSGAGADGGFPDFPASNQPYAAWRSRRQRHPIHDQAALHRPLPLVSNEGEFPFLLQAHGPRQAEADRPIGSHDPAQITQAASGFGPRGADSREWLFRFWRNCGLKSRAAVSDGFLRVDTGVS